MLEVDAIKMDEHALPSPPISHSGDGDDGEDAEEGDSVNPREGSGGTKGKALAKSQDSGVYGMTAVLPRGSGGSSLATLRLNAAGACQC